MFPDSYDFPARLAESFVGVGVAAAVARDLVVPESGCGALGWTVVLGASMPEAAVQEYRDLRLGEDYVSGPAYVGDRPDVNPVAQAESVHGRSERPLGAGVATRVRSHHGT